MTSLSQLRIPEKVQLSFLIVENNELPTYQSIVAEFSKIMALSHVLEPRAGLCFARNKILETVAEMDVDWLGGVDDDQIIHPDWLVHMAAAINEFPETKSFVGDWRRIQPNDMPAWYPTYTPPKNRRNGMFLRELATTNMALHSSIFRADGLGLRYDMAYNFLGGEDVDFGEQYFKTGGKIRFVKDAQTVEDVHRARGSLAARLERSAAAQYILAKVRHRRRSALNAYLWSLQILYRSSVFALANLLLAGLVILFNRPWAMKRYGLALQYYAKTRGVLRYYFGKQAEQYREIDGN